MSRKRKGARGKIFGGLFSALLVGGSHGFAFPSSPAVGNPSYSISMVPVVSSWRQVSCLHSASSSVSESARLSAVAGIPKYVRWQSIPGGGWALQTAVTTFIDKNQQKLQLHAQVHFGEKEYFEWYNSESFNRDRIVLYELLICANHLLATTDNRTVIATPLSASWSDRQTAERYGWVCQVDAIQYQDRSKYNHWIHADMTRQEFFRQQQQSRSPPNDERIEKSPSLWRDSSAAEAATALFVGPPILSLEQRRRLFSNLFLPGDALARTLRALLWFAVPSPELSILLLDWSSTMILDRPATAWSPIVAPVLQTMAFGRFDQLRRLVFGQVLVSGHSTDAGLRGRDDLLVRQRNQKALSVLRETRRALQEEDTIFALLYGCNHCPDLHRSIVRDHGFVPIKTEWRNAWTVTPSPRTILPETLRPRNTDYGTSTAVIGSIFLLFYFAVGGLDWIGTLGDMTHQIDTVSLLATAAFYLARHVLLYVALSKALLDWSETTWTSFPQGEDKRDAKTGAG